QAEDGIRVFHVTGVQTCALPILNHVIAGLCVLVGGILFPVFKTIRLLGMRISSPVRSVKEAYAFGFHWGNKIGKPAGYLIGATRSEERRVGKECGSGWSRWAEY